VQASSGTSGSSGNPKKPPAVAASKPGDPAAGGEKKRLQGAEPATAPPTSGEGKLVYANLDIELAQDDFGIYDIIDSDHIKDYEIIVETSRGDRQYLGRDAVKYLVQNGWLVYRQGVGWVATDRLKRFLGIGEPEEPKESGRPTLGGMTFDGPLENYNPDDPNTPEGKRKILGELNDKCSRTAAWGTFWNCIWSCWGDECRDECSTTYERNKPQVCRDAETLAAQLESAQ
jgi:hypothetical protein